MSFDKKETSFQMLSLKCWAIKELSSLQYCCLVVDISEDAYFSSKLRISVGHSCSQVMTVRAPPPQSYSCLSIFSVIMHIHALATVQLDVWILLVIYQISNLKCRSISLNNPTFNSCDLTQPLNLFDLLLEGKQQYSVQTVKLVSILIK